MKKLLAALLLLPLLASAATVTPEATTASTSGGVDDTSDSFTPVVGDLLVVGVCASGTVLDPAALTSSVGGFTFTQVNTVLSNTSSDMLYLFVSDAFVSSATAQTVTFDSTADVSLGTVIMVAAIAGAGDDGTAAIVQTAEEANQTTGSTPNAVFAGSADTGNPTLGFVCNTANPAGVSEPTGWTEAGDAGYASPDRGGEWVYRNSGFTGTDIVWNSTYGGTASGAAMTVEIEAGAAAPSFSVSPTAAPATDGVTISGTALGDATITVKAVGVSPGDGTPTCTQIQAGQNDGGTAALATGSDTWVATVSNNFTATGTNPIPVMDYHVCARNGSGDSSVVSLANEDRSPRSGYALVTLTSLSATSIFDCAACINGGSGDAYYAPDVAVGDVVEYEINTNESGFCDVSFGSDGDHELDPSFAGACDDLQSFEYSIEDVSSATTGLFNVGTFAADDTVYNGNTAPTCAIESEDAVRLLVEDAAMTAVNMSVIGSCEDEDGHTMSASIDTGTLPVGTALSGTGNLTWSGTPTTEDEGGEAITAEICDLPGDCTTYNFTVYTVNTWAAPNLDDLDVTDAEAAIVAAAPWRQFNPGLSIGDYICGTGQAFLHVADQDPNSGAATGPTEVIDVNLVGAVIPDTDGMTLAEAIAAIEAVCP
jgi:hypothetical protein